MSKKHLGINNLDDIIAGYSLLKIDVSKLPQDVLAQNNSYDVFAQYEAYSMYEPGDFTLSPSLTSLGESDA